jgi:hypothetical protein
MELFVKANYKGWILLECRTEPSDLVAAMGEQRDIFKKLVADAKAKS